MVGKGGDAAMRRRNLFLRYTVSSTDLTEEDVETETFIKESNLSVIERYRERNLDDPDDPDGPDGPDEELAEPDEIGAVPRAAVESHPLVKGLGNSLAMLMRVKRVK